MAQDTFSQIWNRVRLYAPDAPPLLIQSFVRNAYQRVQNMHYWSELFTDGEMIIPADYNTGTVALTYGSPTATLTGGAFTGLTNMQLKVGSQPTYYTITAVSGVGDVTATLDRNYEGATDTAATYNVGQYYVEFPSDLKALDDIRDINRNWRLRRQYQQQNYLDRIDPRRTTTGNPILYVEAQPRISAGVSYPRFEFWPRISPATHLAYRYQKKSDLVASTDRPFPILKPETLVYGALAELALWPGTSDRPNPFFSPETHAAYTKMFEEAVQDSEMNDLDRSQRMLLYEDDNMGLPGDAAWLQSHGIPF